MKIFAQAKNNFVIRLDQGEELITGLKNFCRREKIKAGVFIGLGAAREIELAHYNPAKKIYRDKKLKGDWEIANITGNIARMEKEIIIHAHGLFSNKSLSVRGGHIKNLLVSATCEIFLEVLPRPIERKFSKKIGLNLIV